MKNDSSRRQNVRGGEWKSDAMNLFTSAQEMETLSHKHSIRSFNVSHYSNSTRIIQTTSE